MSCAEVRRALDRYGLLLLQDKKLPSVVGAFAGEPLATSWWNHPRAHEIFRCLEQIEDEALATRLIAGKVTYVHKRLWPAIAAIGSARERWQTSGLSAEARKLVRSALKATVAAKGSAAKELQRRLLVVAEEIHTESGRHELRLESWRHWAERMRVEPVGAEEGRREIEMAAAALGAPPRSLPWHSR
jgi:hypothetical protein